MIFTSQLFCPGTYGFMNNADENYYDKHCLHGKIYASQKRDGEQK